VISVEVAFYLCKFIPVFADIQTEQEILTYFEILQNLKEMLMDKKKASVCP